MKRLFIVVLACLPVFAMAQSKSLDRAASTIANDAKKDAKTAVEVVKKDAKAATEAVKKDAKIAVDDTKKAAGDVKNGEKMPQFPGGEAALQKFLADNVKYPAGQHKDGAVYVKFTVSETGKVQDVKVIKGLDDACDKEAVRVVKAMPDWMPAKALGKNVAFPYNLRIVFKAPAKS